MPKRTFGRWLNKNDKNVINVTCDMACRHFHNELRKLPDPMRIYVMIILEDDDMGKISKERKATYYVGIGMTIIGFLLFISVFFFAASFINDPFSGGRTPPFSNAIIGMILLITGVLVMNIGAKGAAGSGLLLDPEKAREDLKPFNEAKGEMINDVISNIDVVDRIARPKEEKEIIKIRCRSCGVLNDEDAKYCKGCGGEL